MIEILLPILLGIFAGIITGLVPGIHINLVATLALVHSFFVLEYVSLQELIIFLLVMGIIHSFIDFIPSILFGVPSSDTALSVLPGHRLVLEGRGYEAIFLSSLGSLLGMLFSVVIIITLFSYLKSIYSMSFAYIPYVLFFVMVLMISLEPTSTKKFWALIIVLFSGSLGMIALNSYHLQESLLVLFSGLFGISSLLFSLKDSSSIPKQHFKKETTCSWNLIKPLFTAGVCSSICSIAPGLGSAQAATIASLFMRTLSAEIFIVILSSINTINFALSILSLYVLEKARNGVVVVISQLHSITVAEMILYVIIMLLCSIVGFFITILLGKQCIYFFNYCNVKKISIGIIIFIIGLVFFMTSWIGLLYLLLSTSIGLLALELEVKRIHLMSVLLVPVILVLL